MNYVIISRMNRHTNIIYLLQNIMELSIEFGSRELLNAHLDLEEKLIVEIFQLSLNQVLLTDISDVNSLQDLDTIQENIKTVFNLEISQEELEKLTVGQLVLIIVNDRSCIR